MGLKKEFFWHKGKGTWRTNGAPTSQMAWKVLQNMIEISINKENLILVSVDYTDPQLAADIANAYIAQLHMYLNENAVSMAKKNRIFVGMQLKKIKKSLRRNEERLKDFQSENKIISITTQAQEAVKALAELKVQIIAKEAKLGVMRRYTTNQNPELGRLQDEIRELKKQYAMLESEKGNTEPSPIPTLEEAPELGLEYNRLKRQVMLDEKLFELMSGQLETAKIEEAKEGITFQVIDKAIPPQKRIKPNRMFIVLISGTAAIFIGIFLIFLLEYIEKAKVRGKRKSISK